MALRLIIRHDGGQTQVSLRHPHSDDDEDFGAPRPFTTPLTPADLGDLRFYLEEYTLLPVGEYLARGERVENSELARWGEALYAAAFGNDARREAYIRVRTALGEGTPVEVAIRSKDPRFLGLPWELLKAPDDAAPLSTRVARFDRSLLVQDAPRHFADATDGFRVLMVIARPAGMGDTPFQAVARPLFEHLEKHDGPVRIEVLRPPGFAEFSRRLTAANNAGRPYHAVHFDGHGVFGQPPSGAVNPNFFASGAQQGFVVFEQDAGGPHPVSAKDFAGAVKMGGVPLVILNACQSAMLDGANASVGPEASIATRLLQEGAASVVAMTHGVYVVAAAAFMAAFYEALFAGKSVGEAVNIGRKALRADANSLRPGLKGAMKLQDWMVPVHYARSTLRFPVAPRPTAAASPEEAFVLAFADAAASNGADADDPLAANEKFIGRDAEFYALERAIRTHRVALVHGVGGVGKTEVAKAFARWLQMSNGLDNPRLVFHSEFLPGRATFGLDGILGEIMAKLADFSGNAALYLQAPDTKARARLVLRFLTTMRGLLIWDNFETVATMPEPGQATPPLDEAKRAELLWFAGEMRKTRSALIITSRSDEAWLGGPDAVVRCGVRGLGRSDALTYADQVIAPHAAATQRRADDPEEFKELLEYLGGHPLSMKLVLPHLTRETPAALLAALKGLRDLPESERGGARRAELASLTASVEYSIRHLPEDDQRRLVILSLFEKVVSAVILGGLGVVEDAPTSRFAGLNIEGWDALLTRLAGLGLLTSLGGGLYALHPALPPFLAARWRHGAGDGYTTEREQALAGLIGAAASFAERLFPYAHSEIAQATLRQIAAQRSSLGAFLGAALDRHRFAEAFSIVELLRLHWDLTGENAEFQAWADRSMNAMETRRGDAELEHNANDLWLSIKSGEANIAMDAREFDAAKEIYYKLLDVFKGDHSHRGEFYIATFCHQLGIIALEKALLAEAEDWSKKALVIREKPQNQFDLAPSYHQLGIVARLQGKYLEAAHWYKKAILTSKAQNDLPCLAVTYHELGELAYTEDTLDEAERWCQKSLEIRKALSDQSGKAYSYSLLGKIAAKREVLPQAEEWYKKALAIWEVLDRKAEVATIYHRLGSLSLKHERLDEAENWFKRSLAMGESLNDRPHIAACSHQLGIIARTQTHLEDAHNWFHNALAISTTLDHKAYMAPSLYELGAVAQMRGAIADAEILYKKAYDIFEDFNDRSHMALTLGSLGDLLSRQGNDATALRLAIQACAMFDEFPNPHSRAPEILAHYWLALGREAVAAAWREVTGQDLPAAMPEALDALATDLAGRIAATTTGGGAG